MKRRIVPASFCTDTECAYYRDTKNIYQENRLTEGMKEFRDRWGLLTVM